MANAIREMREALKNAQTAYEQAKREALVETGRILRNNGEMTTTELAAATGLSIGEITQNLHQRTRYNSEMIYANGHRLPNKTCRRVMRQYALVENGRVNTDCLIHINSKVTTYSYR